MECDQNNAEPVHRLSKSEVSQLGELADPCGIVKEEDDHRALCCRRGPDGLRRVDRRCVILCVCAAVGFIMNVMVSVVAPFFPAEAETLTGASNLTIGIIFALFPLTTMLCSPLINMAIQRVGRKVVLLNGLILLSGASICFGLSRTVPLWCFWRIIQGAGSAAAGATYYAILTDMYPSNLGWVLGVQESITGLGYMVGPMLGALLYNLGGFPLPFVSLGCCPFLACIILLFVLRTTKKPESSIPEKMTAKELILVTLRSSPTESTTRSQSLSISSTHCASPSSPVLMSPEGIPVTDWRQVATFPFVFIASGACLATLGYSFLEPVLSDHLRFTLKIDTGLCGFLMALPSITYLLSCPLGGWLGEKIGYRPVLFMGFIIFALSLTLLGPVPLIAPGRPQPVMNGTTWMLELIVNVTQTVALAMLGMASAFGSITTLPDLQHITGVAKTTDLTASIFVNFVIPAGEVLGPLLGGTLTELVGFSWAAFYCALGLLVYAFLLVCFHYNGTLPWTHHRRPTGKQREKSVGDLEGGSKQPSACATGEIINDDTYDRRMLRKPRSYPPYEVERI